MSKMQIVGAHCARAIAVVFMLAMLPGCATFYVDDSLHDLSASEKVTVADPRPVQLLFDFQTKGVSNARATDIVKPYVLTAVQGSGLFSQVTSDPAPNGAVLNIVINNVPLTDDAFAKGFVTGFTFGLVGSNVGDGYVCTVDYLPGGSTSKIEKSMRDAIYTSLGATAGTPPHAQKVSGFDVAVQTMVRQVVTNTLNEVAKDKAFTPAKVAAQ
ncbi:MAG TPA: hypothetical protein VKB71_16640 [Rhizomicrobium sp.]|nr:hypothetical protein [Rhizomicrobium sp.]